MERMKQNKKLIFERVHILKIINALCSFAMAGGFIAFFGIWGGMEYGPLMIGQRLSYSLIDVAVVVAAAFGEFLTEEACNELL